MSAKAEEVKAWRASQLATTTGERCGDCGCLITTSAEAFRKQWLFGPPEVERLETDRLCYPEERYSCNEEDCECTQRAKARIRYRYDALVAIAGGVSEQEDPLNVIRRAAPDAADFKSLGKYLRTFWAAPLENPPPYITRCTTLPDLAPGLCEACNGSGDGPIRRGRPTECMVCRGTGNAAVQPAREGAPHCPVRMECGGTCLRAAGHTGLHVCGGDYEHEDGARVPGSCPA